MRSFGRSSDLSVASNRPIAFPVLRHHSRVSPQWPVAFLLRADGSQACGEPRAFSSSLQFRPGPTVVTSRAKRSEECFVPRRDSCCADLPKQVRRDLPRRSTEDPVLVHDPRAWAGGDESLPIWRRAPMPLVGSDVMRSPARGRDPLLTAPLRARPPDQHAANGVPAPEGPLLWLGHDRSRVPARVRHRSTVPAAST